MGRSDSTIINNGARLLLPRNGGYYQIRPCQLSNMTGGYGLLCIIYQPPFSATQNIRPLKIQLNHPYLNTLTIALLCNIHALFNVGKVGKVGKVVLLSHEVSRGSIPCTLHPVHFTLWVGEPMFWPPFHIEASQGLVNRVKGSVHLIATENCWASVVHEDTLYFPGRYGHVIELQTYG